MSIPFDPPNPTQPSLSYQISNNPQILESWTRIGNNLYNTALGNVSIGSTNNTIYKLNVNGSLNSTSLYQNGTQIDFSSYATNTALTNGLATKENTLTFSTPLNKTGSTVTIDLSSKENVLTFNSPLTRTTNTIGINLNSYPTYSALAASNYINNNTNGLINYYNKQEINNISNFNSNYTSQTSNTIYIN